jgi:hypothetical protein
MAARQSSSARGPQLLGEATTDQASPTARRMAGLGSGAQGAGVASRAALPNVATVTWLASVVPVHGDRAVGYRVLASWAEGGTAARRDLSS